MWSQMMRRTMMKTIMMMTMKKAMKRWMRIRASWKMGSSMTRFALRVYWLEKSGWPRTSCLLTTKPLTRLQLSRNASLKSKRIAWIKAIFHVQTDPFHRLEAVTMVITRLAWPRWGMPIRQVSAVCCRPWKPETRFHGRRLREASGTTSSSLCLKSPLTCMSTWESIRQTTICKHENSSMSLLNEWSRERRRWMRKSSRWTKRILLSRCIIRLLVRHKLSLERRRHTSQHRVNLKINLFRTRMRWTRKNKSEANRLNPLKVTTRFHLTPASMPSNLVTKSPELQWLIPID